MADFSKKNEEKKASKGKTSSLDYKQVKSLIDDMGKQVNEPLQKQIKELEGQLKDLSDKFESLEFEEELVEPQVSSSKESKSSKSKKK